MNHDAVYGYNVKRIIELALQRTKDETVMLAIIDERNPHVPLRLIYSYKQTHENNHGQFVSKAHNRERQVTWEFWKKVDPPRATKPKQRNENCRKL